MIYERTESLIDYISSEGGRFVHLGTLHCEGSGGFLARRFTDIREALSEILGEMSDLMLGDQPIFRVCGSIPQAILVMVAQLFIMHASPLVQKSKRSQVACEATAKTITILGNLLGGTYPQNCLSRHLRDLLSMKNGELVMPFVDVLGGLSISHAMQSRVCAITTQSICYLILICKVEV